MNDNDVHELQLTIEDAFQQIKDLRAQVDGLQSAKDGYGVEPSLASLPCPYIFFPVEVKSIVSGSGGFWGEIQKPTTANTFSPWTSDTSLSDIFVSVQYAGDLPHVGTIVRADYLGTRAASPVANYGLLSHPTPVIRGTLAGTMTSGSTATLNVWAGTPITSTSETVTVHDWLIPSGEYLASGVRVKASIDPKSGKYYVDAADECPE